MQPDIDALYAILREWAKARRLNTYGELSREYKARTGDWFEPHGSWDEPLGELNRRVDAGLKAPALSAVVVLKSDGEPGGLFWNCAPNVPARPTTDIDRLAEWSKIVKRVFAFKWPPTLP